MKFDLSKMRANAEQAKKENGGGGRAKTLKLEEKDTYVVFLAKDSEFIKEVSNHTIWKSGKPFASCGDSEVIGEENIIKKEGWKIRDRFKDSGNEKLEKLFTKYMPSQESYAYVIDVKRPEDGVQALRLPNIVKNALLDEFADAVEGVDNDEEALESLKGIFDPDHGRIFKITHNGKKGIEKEYTVAKFLNKKAGLIAKGKITQEAIEEGMFDLSRFQLSCDEARIKSVLKAINDEVKYILDKEDVTDYVEDEDVIETEDFSDDEDFDID